MDEATATQMKIIRMMMLADNLCTRVGMGHDLTPTEALTYKALLDYIRSHARLAELHTLMAIAEMEKHYYGQENEQPPKQQSKPKPKRRVAGDSDGQSDQGAGGAEEDGWLG